MVTSTEQHAATPPPGATGSPGHGHSHGAGHDHEHGHTHAPAGEHNPTSSGPGSVVVDIGGDVGAAVVTTPETLAGREIEIRPAAGEWDGTHVGVMPRHVGSGTIHAALFPGLTAGDYQVRERFGPPDGVVVDVHVVGATVSRVPWPGLEP